MLTPMNPREEYLIRDYILRMNGYDSYDEFLKSDYWKGIKQKTKLPKYRDNYTSCDNCGSKENLHLHHKTYRWLLSKRELMPISCLCETCHKNVHFIAEEKQVNFKKAQDILAYWYQTNVEKTREDFYIQQLGKNIKEYI
jgi:hypothetical protein